MHRIIFCYDVSRYLYVYVMEWYKYLQDTILYMHTHNRCDDKRRVSRRMRSVALQRLHHTFGFGRV